MLAHHEADRDLDTSQIGPIARHQAQTQDAQCPSQAGGLVTHAQRLLGVEERLRKISLGGEERKGLPVLEETFEAFVFEAAGQPLVASAAKAAFVLGFESGRGAGQRGGGEEAGVTYQEADSKPAALGVAGQVKLADELTRQPSQAVDLVLEGGGGNVVSGIMAEDVGTVEFDRPR